VQKNKRLSLSVPPSALQPNGRTGGKKRESQKRKNRPTCLSSAVSVLPHDGTRGGGIEKEEKGGGRTFLPLSLNCPPFAIQRRRGEKKGEGRKGIIVQSNEAEFIPRLYFPLPCCLDSDGERGRKREGNRTFISYKAWTREKRKKGKEKTRRGLIHTSTY